MPTRAMPRRVVPAALVALALAGVAGCQSSSSSASTTAKTAAAAGSGQATSAATSSQASTSGSTAPSAGGVFGRIPTIVRNVEPSVVTIFATTSEGSGLGSGVIWKSGGTLVTDAHVVCGAKESAQSCKGRTVKVAFADGQQIKGQVIAVDKITDVGLVKVSRTNLPAAQFSTHLPQQGELAVAIGSPLGYEDSVTAGIISGVHRQIPGSASNTTPGGLVDLIQTDAAISPGNSGGALVNASGQVVGLNEAYIPPSAGAVSLGFATPAETVIHVAQQLLTSGVARHAFLGIGPTDLTPQIAQQLNTQVQQGVVVLTVANGSPAAQAGLQPGDIIVALGGHQLASVEDLLAVLRQHKPGDKVNLSFVRNGQKHQVSVTLVNRPGPNG